MKRVISAVILLVSAACASGGLGTADPGTSTPAAQGSDGLTAADLERFQPDQLLDQRQRLRLADTQYAALQAVLRDRVDGRSTPNDAARASFTLLTLDQRRAVRAVAPRHGHH